MADGRVTNMGFKVKINQQQLPIKMHYFFFMAAMGPILPFLSVYGKQLGVSSLVMGISTSLLPLFYLVSKPMFGFLVDYFRDHRKTIFLGILISGSMAFVLLYFIPISSRIPQININTTLFNHPSIFCDRYKFCNVQNTTTITTTNSSEINYQAEIIWRCDNNDNVINDFSTFVALVNDDKNNFMIPSCLVQNSQIKIHSNQSNYLVCDDKNLSKYNNISCKINDVHSTENDHNLYRSYQFWIYILLMSIGSVSFNVTNSISDAICFDILGEGGEMGYGRQRVWGTIGFGIAALIAGYAIDFFSPDNFIKSYTPTFILVMIFTLLDVISCKKLMLPTMSSSKTILKDVMKLLKNPTISIFLIFSAIAGIIDSYIIYFLFWYLEDLAIQTNYMHQIKLIEGLTVAAETLGGEVIIFLFSGKILEKLGYGYSFSLCFICYSLRLLLVSLAPNPWWIVFIELFMQGPTYALGYTIIVSMASAIAPPGTSATVQGIAAGMDDGFGYALGSLIGGILYHEIGGVTTFRVFSILALSAGIVYLLLYIKILKNNMPDTKSNKKCNDVVWRSPENALQELESADKDVTDLIKLGRVCKRFNDIVNDDALWIEKSNKPLATNQSSKKFRERCNPLLCLRTKWHVCYNWLNGKYGKTIIHTDRINSIPWIQMTEKVLWWSGGNKLCGYHRSLHNRRSRDPASNANCAFKRTNIISDICKFVVRDEYIVSGHRDGSIWFWVKNTSPGGNFNAEIKDAHASSVNAIDHIPHAIISGAADGTVKIWPETSEIFDIQPATTFSVFDRIWSLACESIESKIAVGSSGTHRGPPLHIFDIEYCRQLDGMRHNWRHGAGILDMVWETPQCLLTCGYDTYIRKWDMRTGTCVASWGDPTDATLYCISTDYNYTMVTGTQYNGKAVLWDQRESKYIQLYFMNFRRASSPVYSIAFDSSHLYGATDRQLVEFTFAESNHRQRDYRDILR
ncbi:hypothetical protein PV328_003736 [Microctonus aethiopoides]|uniref:Uncharacterized protein n=1 Tax=Microctonus aethiopoides TaxID=144406 RepID=A0AA39F9A4_9HYME|nr:hypothetical protein PV328_003736 [Microctonus aethiopoides]